MERCIYSSIRLKETSFYIIYTHKKIIYYSLKLQWRTVISGTREYLWSVTLVNESFRKLKDGARNETF